MATRGIYAWIASSWLMLFLLILGITNHAQANPRYAGIVVDLGNGEVLYSENADEPRYPASLTKMMTMYMTFEAIENGRLTLEQALPVSAQAAAMPASKLWLAAGSTIPVDTAMRALAVRSANDVAVVVAEAIGGTEQRFAQMMTDRARELGMSATTFRNASGLPNDQQITTARDMLTLSVRVMQDYPQYYHYFGLQEFSFRGTRHTSHNRLVRDYPGADGLKTGFIRASGFNVATTAIHNNRRMVAVVMGGFSASSRDTHMANLLDRSFGRAALRDQGTWLASTHFSQEFMSFNGSGPTYSLPPTQHPAPNRTMVASTTPQATTPPPVATVERQLARQEPQTPAVESDPLHAFIEREQVLTPRAQEPMPSGSWGIQVGAFSQAAQAEQLAHQAAQRLPNDIGGRVAIDTLEGQTTVFRARVVALDEVRARQGCRALQAQGMDCMVVNASL